MAVEPLHDYPPEYVIDRAVLDVDDAIAELEHQFIHHPQEVSQQFYTILRTFTRHAEALHRIASFIGGKMCN